MDLGIEDFVAWLQGCGYIDDVPQKFAWWIDEYPFSTHIEEVETLK
jgi:hypothetical protein